MPLHVYTIEQTVEWDRVVKSFASFDVYYLSGYVKAFQIHGDGQPLLFYYEDKNIRGINVVMKRDIADDPYFFDKISRDTLFDFTTPYGYGGWMIEGNDGKDSLFFEYEKWCIDHNIVSEFVRFHPVLNKAVSSNSFYDIEVLGNTISMDLSSPDEIWKNLTSKNRNMVRKAEKSGVEIFCAQTSEMYKTFKNIYDLTMDFDHAKTYYYFEDEFYKSIERDLSDQAQVFWAEVNGKIIAASIMIYANGHMNYHLSGALREYRSVAPSNLLLYKAALWGCENGYKSLHLGGGVGAKEDSLYKFKSAFNRNYVNSFSIGKKIYQIDTYKNLVSMKSSIGDEGFFPEYRA